MNIFKEQKDLTINKNTEPFEYFFKFILNDTKDDLDVYKVNFNDKKIEKKTKDELEKYFKIKEDNAD